MTTALAEAESTTVPATEFTYLADFIKEVPEERRLTFISALKAAIRDGVFDGSPLRDQFTLTYQGRGKTGLEKRKCDQRDFAVEATEAFKQWFGLQLTTTPSRSPFPSRDQLSAGTVSLHDLATKFRNRSGGTGKRKARK
ncbi:hypothetical protein [Deinococcus humi]|uniref:Uncharacterized protein n=1 Tax=Deinococcus humi TaxID=662880 RepID=A0A7W8JZX3_9DEIO|nr:hypothetical protein [Deinococcus humi]MBB5366244.1 hypothetical protein [Deinococcus humi]GGO40890.1 hypothetical protein GCM10008949_50940 [Deinococcus humi]